MTIHHHPDDDLLLALAAGTLAAGPELVLRVHLEQCGACRARLRTLEDLGGLLFEDVEPVPLAAGAWAGTLERIVAAPRAAGAAQRPRAAPSASSASGSSASSHSSGLAASSASSASTSLPPASLRLPPDFTWPRSLRGCSTAGWRWAGPGMAYARLVAPIDPQANLLLLRIGAGRHLARHRHTGVELTQVLSGQFDDGRATFAAGDFDAADGRISHEPRVPASAPCVCLASMEGALQFEGRVGRLLGRWLGL